MQLHAERRHHMRNVDTGVLVIGGGNAALCSALSAADNGANVLLVEAAPFAYRGGNSRHTRNLRDVHAAADGFVSGPYSEDEFLADLQSVTGDSADESLAQLAIHQSAELPDWMRAHGANFQPPLHGALHLARTNHFFLGGGKALLNSYYRAAERLGIHVRYGTHVRRLEIEGRRCVGVEAEHDGELVFIRCESVVAAAGGFEANLAWLREIWGERANNFVIRGTPYNTGTVLAALYESGVRAVGDPFALHAIAVDARAPTFDGGIATRIDAVPFGIVVNRDGQRFADEGENIWPKRYASWGSLIADQPGQQAYVLFDAKAVERFIPGMYPPMEAETLDELAEALGLDPAAVSQTTGAYNAACQRDCTYDPGSLDNCQTDGLEPRKSHWALPLDLPPFRAYPLRPGITFTYLGVAVDDTARVLLAAGSRLENVFAAGEIMAGNILTRGYLAGFGMTIGSVFGRIAGAEAARCLN
jgi:tricarballylate dehydrogenase